MNVKLTAPQARDLARLAEGGDISEARFFKLCDLGLAGFERKTTLRGTNCVVNERAWITAAGKKALASQPADQTRQGEP